MFVARDGRLARGRPRPADPTPCRSAAHRPAEQGEAGRGVRCNGLLGAPAITALAFSTIPSTSVPSPDVKRDVSARLEFGQFDANAGMHWAIWAVTRSECKPCLHYLFRA